MVKKMERVKKRMESNLVQVFMVKGLKKLLWISWSCEGSCRRLKMEDGFEGRRS